MRYLVNALLFIATIFYTCSDYNGLNNPVTDSEMQWEQLNGPYGVTVNSATLSSSGKIFIATENGINYSVNNGDNWISTGLKGERILYIYSGASSEVHAFSGKNYYLSNDEGYSWIKKTIPVETISYANLLSDGKIFIANGYSIFISADNGNKWETIRFPEVEYFSKVAVNSKGTVFFLGCSNKLFRLQKGDTGFRYINYKFNELNVDVFYINKNDRIYAGLYNGQLLFSDDEGITWNSISSPLKTNPYAIFENKTGNIFYSAFNACFISKDGGNTWINCFQKSNVTHKFFESNYNLLFVNSLDGSIFRSIDGINWEEKTDGLLEKSINSIYINSSENIYAAGYFDKLYISENKGRNWISKNAPTPIFSLNNLSINNLDYLIFLGADGKIYLSPDNGDTWNNISGNLSIPSYALNSKGHIYASTFENELYYSTNTGGEWKKIRTPNILFQSIFFDSHDNIFILQKPPGEYYPSSHPDYSSGTGIFISTNNGSLWKQIDNSVTDHWYWNVISNKEGTIFANTSENFFRIKRFHNSWRTEALPKIPRMSRIKSLNNLLIGYGELDRIYYSTNEGNSWIKYESMLQNSRISDITLGQDNKIYISSNGKGIWRTKKTIDR